MRPAGWREVLVEDSLRDRSSFLRPHDGFCGDFHTGFLMGSGNNNLGNCQAAVGLIGSAKQFLGYSIFFANPKFEFGPWSATKVTLSLFLAHCGA